MQGQQSLAANPNFVQGQQLGLNLALNPYTFTPSVVSGLENNVKENAYGAYGGQLNQLNEQATAAQGFRSGTSNHQRQLAAQGLGANIAAGNRQIETQAAMQRPQDVLNAMNAQLPYLQVGSQFSRDISNAYTGNAANPIWQQPSVGQQIGSGIGGLAGLLLPSGLAPGSSTQQAGFLRK